MNLFIYKNGSSIEFDDKEILRSELENGNITLRDLSSLGEGKPWIPLYRNIRKSPLESYQFSVSRDGEIIGSYDYFELQEKINNKYIYNTDYYWYVGQSDWNPIFQFLNYDAQNFILFNRNDILYGPYNPEEIERFLKNSSLSLYDYCWMEGLEDWILLIHIIKILNINLKYKVKRENEEFGPYTLLDIKDFLYSGNLSPNDLVTGPGIDSLNSRDLVQMYERTSNLSLDSNYIEQINTQIDVMKDDSILSSIDSSSEILDDRFSNNVLDDQLSSVNLDDTLSESASDSLVSSLSIDDALSFWNED